MPYKRATSLPKLKSLQHQFLVSAVHGYRDISYVDSHSLGRVAFLDEYLDEKSRNYMEKKKLKPMTYLSKLRHRHRFLKQFPSNDNCEEYDFIIEIFDGVQLDDLGILVEVKRGTDELEYHKRLHLKKVPAAEGEAFALVEMLKYLEDRYCFF